MIRPEAMRSRAQVARPVRSEAAIVRQLRETPSARRSRKLRQPPTWSLPVPVVLKVVAGAVATAAALSWAGVL